VTKCFDKTVATISTCEFGVSSCAKLINTGDSSYRLKAALINDPQQKTEMITTMVHQIRSNMVKSDLATYLIP
jgi:hypothetical protein